MRLLLFCTALYFTSIVSGQTNQKMIEAFGQEKVSAMKEGNPGLYEIYDAYSNQGIELINTYIEKYESADEMPIIKSRSTGSEILLKDFLIEFESADFNILKYTLFPTRQIQIYKLDSGKYLKIESQQNLLNNL